MSWRGKRRMPFKKKIQNTAEQHVFIVAAVIWRMCHLNVPTPTKDRTDTILSTLQPDRPLGGCSGHLFLRGRQRGRWGTGQGRGRAEEERGKRVQGRGEVRHGILQMQRSYSGKWSRASWVFMNLSSWNVVELLDLYSGRSRKDKLVAVLFHRWGNWRLRSKPSPHPEERIWPGWTSFHLQAQNLLTLMAPKDRGSKNTVWEAQWHD